MENVFLIYIKCLSPRLIRKSDHAYNLFEFMIKLKSCGLKSCGLIYPYYTCDGYTQIRVCSSFSVVSLRCLEYYFRFYLIIYKVSLSCKSLDWFSFMFVSSFLFNLQVFFYLSLCSLCPFEFLLEISIRNILF